MEEVGVRQYRDRSLWRRSGLESTETGHYGGGRG